MLTFVTGGRLSASKSGGFPKHEGDSHAQYSSRKAACPVSAVRVCLKESLKSLGKSKVPVPEEQILQAPQHRGRELDSGESGIGEKNSWSLRLLTDLKSRRTAQP